MKTSRQTKSDEKRRLKDRIFLENIKGALLPVCLGLAALLCICAVRLIQISTGNGEEYEKRVVSQQDYSTTTIAYRRGTITDRNSTVLATSERRYTLILDPKVILDEEEDDSGKTTYNEENITATLNALQSVYGIDPTEAREALIAKHKSSYLRYKKEITEDEKTAFEEYKTNYNSSSEDNEGEVLGVWFEEEYKRIYPFNEFACSLLGFSGSDSSRGNYGIEEYYNDELVGTNGQEYGYVNSDGVAERKIVEAEDGNTIVSTIDYSIQLAAENAIDEFLVNHTADNVAAIVMNPKNGEILAMATDKTYDLNNPSDITLNYTEEEVASFKTDEELTQARADMWKNFAIADAYEPGSTAKPFTVAAALEKNLVNEKSKFTCTGAKHFGSGGSAVTVHCNDREGHGELVLAQGLMFSCNSVMMDIAELLGAENFSEFQGIFGFGKQSGVDLPGETAGLVYSAETMGSVDLATNSFGQNFNVNMVQQVSAFCSLMNGGHYYQPHVVKQILSSEGQVIKEVEPTLVRETVSEETSEFIKSALFETVENGTAKTAIISGYSIGGKTGTAEKLPREDKKYLVSFIAAAPIDDPEVVIYVIVDNPSVNEDEDVSAKLAIAIEKNIMEAIIPYLNLKASDASAVDTEALGNIFDFEFSVADEVASSNIDGDDGSSENTTSDSDDDSDDEDNDNSSNNDDSGNSDDDSGGSSDNDNGNSDDDSGGSSDDDNGNSDDDSGGSNDDNDDDNDDN